MSYVLLWVVSLAALLMLAAAGMSLTMRPGRWRPLRLMAAWACGAVPLAAVSALAVLAFVALNRNVVNAAMPVAFAGLAAALAVGEAALLIRWRRDRLAAAQTPARWSARALWGGFGLLALAWLVIVWHMDLTARVRLASLRMEAAAMVLSLVPPATDEDNAAPVYQEAFDRLALSGGGAGTAEDRDLLASEPGAPEQSRVVALLERHAATVALLRRAAMMPRCRFDHDYAHPGPRMALPELSGMRLAARLLRLHARGQIAAGNADEAAADIQAMFRMARHTADSPLLISMLVALNINALAVETMEEALPHLRTAEQLARVEPLKAESLARLLKRSMLMEEAFGLGAFADMAGGEINPALIVGDIGESCCWGERLERRAGSWSFRVFLLPTELPSYRRHMARYQSLADAEYHHSRRSLDAPPERGTGVLTRMLLPALSRCFEAVAIAQARNEAARMVLAAARCALDTGRLPAQAGDLVGKYLESVPTDPFNGRPMRLMLKDGVVLAYSVGPDGADDGGRRTDNPRQGGDIVVSLRPRAGGAGGA